MVRIEKVALVLGLVLAGAGVGMLPPRQPAGIQSQPLVDPNESPIRDRREFVGNLNRIQPGMTAAQVRGLLGKPDDIWVDDECENSLASYELRDAAKVWAYGGNGHLTYATLGCVGFDGQMRVTAVSGQLFDLQENELPRVGVDTIGDAPPNQEKTGRIPSLALPDERETRRILRLISGLRGYDQSNDPLRVIQVVNALQPLGKESALAVIDESLRTNYKFEFGGDGLFVVVRCLFDVPKTSGYLPMMAVGAPHPDGPKDPKQSPRFPVVLFRDIPLSGVNGYSLNGVAERLEWHLEPYRKWYSIRKQPLRPPDHPLELVDDLLASPEWPDWGSSRDEGKRIAREQLLRLVDSAYRVEPDEWGYRLLSNCCDIDVEPFWLKHTLGFASVGARWDAVRNVYVRADGTYVPPVLVPATYPRKWNAATPYGTMEVHLQRRDAKQVDIHISPRSKEAANLFVKVHAGPKELTSGYGLVTDAGSSMTTGFSVREGSELRVTLLQANKVVAEKVMRP